MERLLNKDTVFIWSQECQVSFEMLKAKMASASIVIFPDGNKEFHVDALSIVLGVVLAQPGEGYLDHPIDFGSQKLSFVEKKYTTIEREGLAMVYAIQKFRHYLLGDHFKIFLDHSSLKYLVNKPMLGANICHRLLLFQEFNFKIILKLSCLNACPYHLSRIELGEEPTNIKDRLPDA